MGFKETTPFTIDYEEVFKATDHLCADVSIPIPTISSTLGSSAGLWRGSERGSVKTKSGAPLRIASMRTRS